MTTKTEISAPVAKKVCTNIVPVADSLLDAFSNLSYVECIRANDRDNLEALATLLITKLHKIPVEARA